MNKDIPSLIETFIKAGFPSPAEDAVETPLNLHDLMVKKPAATFFIRVAGDSMKDAGIIDQDLLVVDRSIQQAENKIIVARVNDEFTVKRLLIVDGHYVLYPENSNYPPLVIKEGMDFEIWGVVTYAIHSVF
jgi:DNA polymerase V